MIRYPQLDLDAVIAECPTRQAARIVTKFAGTQFRIAEAAGLSVEQADRIAGRLGMHPDELWPLWSALSAAEVSKRCEECAEPFVPGRYRTQRFCSRRCSRRRWDREKRATNEAFAEQDRAKSRRYYAECGNYARAAERRRYWARKAAA